MKNRFYTRLLAIVFIAIGNGTLSGQLVPNGSFEYSVQPVHYQQIHFNFNPQTFAQGWTTPTGGSPDLFDDGIVSSAACGNPSNSNDNPLQYFCYPQVCAWENIFGQQSPHSGYRHAGFHCGTEYIQTRLQTPLTAGQCYELRFWVSRGDRSTHASKMQVVISKTNMHNLTSSGAMAYTSDAIVLTSRNVYPNKLYNGWTEVVFNFKATGGEQYLTIGLFDVNGIWDPISQATIPVQVYDVTSPGDCGSASNPCATCQSNDPSYYYIDDVSLAPAGPANFQPDQTFENETVSGNWTWQNILLTGTITLGANLTIDNSQVRCNSNTTIVVPAGITLRIQNSNLSAGCDHMWNGIVVSGSAASNGFIEVTGSSIEDAITAITLNSNTRWEISGGSVFNRNAVGITVNGSGPAGNFIKSSTFDLSAPLKDASQGTGGYGTTGIAFKAQGTGPTETVGGLSPGEGCTFIKGQYSITSIKRDLAVYGCTFNNVLWKGIYFQGYNYPTKRTLTVLKSIFNNNLMDIYSETLSNLVVRSSQFNGTRAMAISWYDNPDCDLIIGSPTNPALANIFKGCYTAVECWNNQSTGTTSDLLDPMNGSNYTDISIAGNMIYGVMGVYSYKGIGLSEYFPGSNVDYHTCLISNNFFSEVAVGIEFTNVKGWGGVFANNNNNNTTLPDKIENNIIGITTAFQPTGRGINIKNSPGLNIVANGISSTSPGDWRNYGIQLENSPNTEMVGNAINAGTGIIIVGDNMYSNIHCNSLAGNSCGINLVYSRLRPQNVTHGLQTEAFNNYFTGPAIPYAIEFQNYFSNDLENRWYWDYIATPAYPRVWNSSAGNFETNLAPSSLIAYNDGTDNCQYQPVFGGDMFDVPHAGGPNVSQVLSDPVAQWIAHYNYEIQRINTGEGDATIVPRNIRDIISIEDAFAQQQFSDVAALLAGFSPSNTVEENYESFASVMLAISGPVQRDATPEEKAAIVTVAEQSPRLGGPAVYLARAYLAVKFNMHFEDEDYAGPKIHGTAVISTPCSLIPASGTVLTFISEDGTELPIPGATVYQDGSFTFDPFQIAYYEQQSPSLLYRIAARSSSTYTVLNNEFRSLSDWISNSPISIALGGVQLASMALATEANITITPATRMTDAVGNTYTVGATGGRDADFLLEKRDKDGTLLWSRTYGGEAAGSDAATCLALDDEGSIYIAGKVWTGTHYNFQAIKYNASGFMQWAAAFEDEPDRDNVPTAIGVGTDDGTVTVTGTCTGSGIQLYRTVAYLQCIGALPKRPVQEQTELSAFSSIEFYPNPSDGNITLVLKNSEGGTVELYNLTGQLVLSRQITGSVKLDLPEAQLPDGLYMLKFTGRSGVSMFDKLVIRRN